MLDETRFCMRHWAVMHRYKCCCSSKAVLTLNSLINLPQRPLNMKTNCFLIAVREHTSRIALWLFCWCSFISCFSRFPSFLLFFISLLFQDGIAWWIFSSLSLFHTECAEISPEHAGILPAQYFWGYGYFMSFNIPWDSLSSRKTSWPSQASIKSFILFIFCCCFLESHKGKN